MKNAWLLFVILCCISCNLKSEDKDLAREVTISGRILNREVYPNENSLTLVVPFFSGQEAVYKTPIADDCTFSFRFPVHAPVREVLIRNYAEHLYVHPGDSLYVEIDFADLLSPKVEGTADTLNKYMALFFGKGYYRDHYPYDINMSPKEFDVEMKKEYDSRMERRNDFLKEYSPGEEVERCTAELLLVDYYAAIFEYAAVGMSRGKNTDKYEMLLPKVDALFSGETVFANLFKLAADINLYYTFKEHAHGNRLFKITDLLEDLREHSIVPYLYAGYLGNTLVNNDTSYFVASRQQFDSIVQIPHLKQSVLQLYQSKCDFLKDPKQVSDYMLYGCYPNRSVRNKDMSFMAPVYRLLDKYKGKIIYIDFWTTTCGPCLAEMNPLKSLRKRYTPEDVVMISICSGRNRGDYQKVLKRFSLEGQGIECIYVEDWATSEEFFHILAHWNMHSSPQYLLINRDGVIVDYGSALRPSYPRTTVRLNELL